MTPPDQKEQGDETKPTTEAEQPAVLKKVSFSHHSKSYPPSACLPFVSYASVLRSHPQQPAHGFRSVPRALLVERAGKDKAKALKLGDRVMKSMAGEEEKSGGGGGSGGPSALER